MGKRFNRLERKVEREYEKKGYSKKTSEAWGRATAGKVFREQQATAAKVFREQQAKKRCTGCGTMGSASYGSCHNCGLPG